MLPESTRRLLLATARRGDAAGLLALREWGKVGGSGDWLEQWQKSLPRVSVLVAAAQVAAAKDAAASIADALEETGYPEQQLGTVIPRKFAGWSEKLPVPTLLSTAVVKARMAPGDEDAMLAVGGGWLQRMVSTLVTDAGRAAGGVQIAATENAGWVRHEPSPYCMRCAPLVGEFYRHNQGFQRHPQCPAVHRPASDREPHDGWSSAPDPSEIKDLTEAQRKALDEGADLNKVVNAHRRKPMDVAGVGNAQRRGTPAWIYKQAGDDRAAAAQLLRQFGYIQ